mgnify:CR=1 FL=1
MLPFHGKRKVLFGRVACACLICFPPSDMDAVKRLLDGLPMNGYKSWAGLFAGALVLGFQQMGYLDPHYGSYLLDAITLWTGLAIFHKDLKASPVG